MADERRRQKTILNCLMLEREPSYVIVCRGPSCRERGGLPLRSRLVTLLRSEVRARVIGYACFGQCDDGPNVAFYPEGTWYGRLCEPDSAEQVVAHAIGQARLAAAPLQLPDPDRREHLRNIAELVSLNERGRAAAATRRWWWPF
jgi:(2Fe-2S) ferredoxin